MDGVLWLQVTVILIGIISLIFIFWYLDNNGKDKK